MQSQRLGRVPFKRPREREREHISKSSRRGYPLLKPHGGFPQLIISIATLLVNWTTQGIYQMHNSSTPANWKKKERRREYLEGANFRFKKTLVP